jgi:ankyrin repeat protein
VKTLVDAGADITAKNEKGETAMMVAGAKGKAECYKFLKELEDKLKEEKKGETEG